MITSLEITRLRGIREGKLEDLTPLVVLVGPNACGKSTVLDAVLIGASRDLANDIGRAVRRHEGVRQGARWLLWRVGTFGRGGILTKTGKDYFRHYDLELTRPGGIAVVALACSVEDGYRKGSGVARVEFGPGNKIEATSGDVPYPPIEDLPGARIIEGHWEHDAAPLHQILTMATEQGLFDQVMGLVQGIIPDIRDIRILTEGDSPIVQLVYEDHSVPAALAGDGVHSLLRTCLELASHPSQTVLLEEPELHKHPAAIRQTIRAILAAVRRDIQVVLTTHSLELIDAILAEASDEDLAKLSVYRLGLDEGRLLSVRMSGDEVAFSRMEIENDLR